MKLCRACNASKPLDQFSKDRSKRDGLNAYCIPCSRAKAKAAMGSSTKWAAKDGNKVCPRCKTVKPVEDFGKSTLTSDGLDKNCKACRRELHADWRLRNLGVAAANAKKWRDANPILARDHGLKTRYGLEIGGYDRMLAEQEGRCAICRTDDPKGRGSFHVDHCHDSNEIRGLLCHGCNVGIGSLQHSEEILEAAIRYLQKYP